MQEVRSIHRGSSCKRHIVCGTAFHYGVPAPDIGRNDNFSLVPGWRYVGTTNFQSEIIAADLRSYRGIIGDRCEALFLSYFFFRALLDNLFSGKP